MTQYTNFTLQAWTNVKIYKIWNKSQFMDRKISKALKPSNKSCNVIIGK